MKGIKGRIVERSSDERNGKEGWEKGGKEIKV
jgi:hypothetical protein